MLRGGSILTERLPHSPRLYSRFARSFATSPRPQYEGCPIDQLERRGLVSALTSRKVIDRLASKPTVSYAGVDPTAASLHVGNLVPLIALLHLTLAGHPGIAMIGGATGSIGDPSGRSTERRVISQGELNSNVDAISSQLRNFFLKGQAYGQKRLGKASPGIITIRDNREWLSPMSVLQFLGTIGRHARIGPMLARESVKSRMSSSQGLSFTEFSYQLLQAYDFYHMFKHDDCRIQLGGSDQWGNITAGTELISKLSAEEALSEKREPTATEAYGVTTPLLTTSSGEKFGKSAGNAVWIDPQLTSIFDFYQFFIRTPDADVFGLLRKLTLVPLDEIDDILRQHEVDPSQRLAQKRLALEMTEMVHSETDALQAEWMTQVLYNPSIAHADADRLVMAFANDSHLQRHGLAAIKGATIESLLVLLGIAPSKTAATKKTKSGSIYINGVKVAPSTVLSEEHLLQDRAMIVRVGKIHYTIVEAI